MRPSGRLPDQLRDISFEPGFAPHAEGSCLIRAGNTHVLCTASVQERVPPFLRNTGQGWVTAEYGMLPRSTDQRTNREAARGKQSGRTQEIQRLIGRSLRAVTDLSSIGERQIILDCDVLRADGGTRCASITGAYVALHQALSGLVDSRRNTRLAAARAGSRGVLRHRRGRSGSGPRLSRGQRRRSRCQLHPHGLRRDRRDPGDSGEGPARPRKPSPRCTAWP